VAISACIVPDKSNAKTTSILGAVPGMKTVLLSEKDPPGGITPSNVSGVMEA
jgi:hypothetical protein